jgi:hypothetical protein
LFAALLERPCDRHAWNKALRQQRLTVTTSRFDSTASRTLGMYKIDIVQRSLLMRFGPITNTLVVSKHALVGILRATIVAADEAAAERVDGHRRRQANAEVRLVQIKALIEKRKR